MQWMGLICLGIVLCYSSYPKRVRTLERKLKKLESKNKGENAMSKLISGLIGKKCRITISDDIFSGNAETVYEVLDADEEWIKVTYMDKKKGQLTKLMRIDDINGIEEISEQ